LSWLSTSWNTRATLPRALSSAVVAWRVLTHSTLTIWSVVSFSSASFAIARPATAASSARLTAADTARRWPIFNLLNSVTGLSFRGRRPASIRPRRSRRQTRLSTRSGPAERSINM
jgi:hypothetical protein